MSDFYIDPTARVAPGVEIGAGTKIWMNAQVREGVKIGSDCVIGKDAYIDFQVTIGNKCKIQNGAKVYHLATLGEGVFVGPGATLTNDLLPRALRVDGGLSGVEDWHSGHIRIERGASIGAGAILLTDITVGEFALIGAGAVVTRNVVAHSLVLGNPARYVGYVCKCGRRLTEIEGNAGFWICERDGNQYHSLTNGGLIAR